MTKIPLKGGSLCGTFLIDTNPIKFVRKEVSLKVNREYGFQRWYSQLKRLQRYSIQFPGIFPKVLKYGKDNDTAYFDIEYMEDYISSHEFLISTNSISDVKKFTKSLISTMSVMHKVVIPSNFESIQLYIHEEVEQRLSDCYNDKQFKQFLKNKYVYYNNKRIPSFITQLQKYTELFSNYESPVVETFTHGNLTLENTVYSPKLNKVVFIDPYEENIIDSKLADYSQLYQSCHSKYEILNNIDTSVQNNKTTVNIPTYQGLFLFNELFTDFVNNTCTSKEIIVIKLLEISQFIRMLTFKVSAGNTNKAMFFYILASHLFQELQNELMED